MGIRSIGWYINPELQGKGLAYEAAVTVLDFMFSQVEIDRVETSAITVNEPSWRLMEKLGFVRTGTMKASYKDMDENDLYKYTYTLTKAKFYEKVNSNGNKRDNRK